jgi:hypothetical protein
MKIARLSLFILFAACFVAEAQTDYVQKELNVTVYNNNLGVVRDIRQMDIKKGISDIKITDVPTEIDPTSVHAKLDGTVLEQNYQYDLVNIYKILDKYIDKEISVKKDGVTLTGTLLSSGDGFVLRMADGNLTMIPEIKKWEISTPSLPEGLITRPTLLWKVDSKKAGKQDVEISYHTGNMKWHAEYVATLNEDDTKMDLNAWVSINNGSGKTFKDAKLKLIAGEVNRVSKYSQTLSMHEDAMERAIYYNPQSDFQEESFFEYHMYNLQRKTTLADNETKQINLFNAEDVKIKKKFQYKSYGQVDDGRAKVVVEFTNEKSNNLGMPFPKGVVRVNKSNGESVEFIGEDRIDHTPRKEKVELEIGEAFDVVIDEIELNYHQISKKVSEREYQLKVKNRKENEDIVLEVERVVGRYGEIIESSIDFEKKDSMISTFNVEVPKDSEVILKYKLRYVFE